MKQVGPAPLLMFTTTVYRAPALRPIGMDLPLIDFLTPILHGKEKLAQPFFFRFFSTGHSKVELPPSFSGFFSSIKEIDYEKLI
jgi:hypothetical protein